MSLMKNGMMSEISSMKKDLESKMSLIASQITNLRDTFQETVNSGKNQEQVINIV